MTGLFLGNAHADQGADDSTGSGADPGAGDGRATGEAEGGSERTTGDHRADARNGQRTGTDEEAQDTAEQATAEGAGRGAFGRLRTGIFDELILLAPVTHGDADVFRAEAGGAQVVDRPLGVGPIVEQAGDGLASGHVTRHGGVPVGRIDVDVRGHTHTPLL